MDEEAVMFQESVSEPREPSNGPEPDDFEDFPLAEPGALAAGSSPQRPALPATPRAAGATPPAAAAIAPIHVPVGAPPLDAPPAPAARGARNEDPLAATVQFNAALLGAAVGAAAPRSYRWRDAHGEETPLERRDVIRLIRDGTLGPEDHLAEGGSPYKRASEYEDLSRYFQLRLAPVVAPAASRSSGPLLGCGKHPQTHAAWCCGMCGLYWCEACAPPKRIANTTVTPCPHCSEPCMPVQAHVEVVPFWREIGSLFLYPISGWGSAMWLMYSVILWVSQVVISMGPLMLFAWACLNFFALTYSMLIVKESAEGRRKIPDWPDFSEWWDIIGRGFRGFLCSIIAFLPLFVYGFVVWKLFGSGIEEPADLVQAAGILLVGAIPLVLFTAIYYPMVFLIACLFDTIVPALNPVLIFKAIVRIPFDYTIALIFIGVLFLTGALLSFPFRFVPIIGGLPAAIINSYFTFMWLHVLGRMAHQCEARLNWSV